MKYNKYISQFSDVLERMIITNNRFEVSGNDNAVDKITDEILKVKKNNGTVYLVGNGGSSAIVSHASIDLLNTCKVKAVPITDNSQITCFANDYGYENVYSKPLEVLLNSNDLLIAISSSGKSVNIINAVNVATSKNCFALTLSGFLAENPLRKIGTQNIWIESSDYGIVEIGHALILHHITDIVTEKSRFI
jgi:D-sedoheptulose 7-phosphate isomerase